MKILGSSLPEGDVQACTGTVHVQTAAMRQRVKSWSIAEQ